MTDLHAPSATSPPTQSVRRSVLSAAVGFVKNEVWTYSARDNELAERTERLLIHFLFSAICIRSSYVSVEHCTYSCVDRPKSFPEAMGQSLRYKLGGAGS